MNKIIFSILAAALLVLVPITKSYALYAPAKQYTEKEQEQLIKEYDELYDSWVSNGLSFEKIYENSLNWVSEKGLTSSSSLFLKHYDQKLRQAEQKK